MIMWCLWLMASWAINHDFNAPVPAARWMIFSAWVGMAVVWPTWRLSVAQGRRQAGRQSWPLSLSILLDWLNLNLVLQAVIWPLRLTTGWTIGQTIWLCIAIASWSLLVAAVVAWGVRTQRGGRRTAAMIVCLILLLGEPVLIACINHKMNIFWSMVVSPIEAIRILTTHPSIWPATLHGPRVVVSIVMACTAWAALAVVGRVTPEC